MEILLQEAIRKVRIVKPLLPEIEQERPWLDE